MSDKHVADCSERLGEKLLQGYTMLDELCPGEKCQVCDTPEGPGLS
jgi:hypothetical protein